MADNNWVVVAEVFGMPMAELLSSMLEANGVEVTLSQESYAQTLGLTVGPASLVQIMASSQNMETAKQIVENYYAAIQQDETGSPEPGESPDDPQLQV